MPSPTKGPRLGGSPSHQRIILGNLASQLFEHRRLVTTEAKAKRLRPLAEKLITKAKRGDLHARRQVMRVIRENDERSIVHTLFTDIAPGFADRAGGYVRITKVGPRKGDNAPMAVIELVTETVEEGRTSRADAARKTAKKAPAKRAAGRAGARPLADEPPAGAAVADQPVTDQVAADQPGTGQVAADQPATDQVAADQPATYQAAGTDQPGTEQAAATDQAVPTDQEVAADAEELAPEEMAADAAEAAEDADEQPGAPR